MLDYIPVTSLVIVVSAFLVLSCGQTDAQTDADERLSLSTLVCIDKDKHLAFAIRIIQLKLNR